jgi:DNA (cytosine-5)-methyltransferase 1
MTHASLFTGIGGFDLAAQWAGIDNIFQVEIDNFCIKILEKNFPNVKKYLDIKEFDGTEYTGRIDVLTGGFPCQPFSQAGQRKGNKDERALFPQMLRVIREVRPKWIVAENVSGILSIHDGEYFEEISASLENEGYEVQSFIIPASAVNAPHRRDRVWIIANLQNAGTTGRFWKQGNDAEFNKQRTNKQGRCYGVNGSPDASNAVNSTSARQRKHSGKILLNKESEGFGDNWSESWYEVAQRFCELDDGLSQELDKLETPDRVNRLKGLGNAIVPQIAYIIFMIIKEVE